VATPREQLASVLRQGRVDAGYKSHGALAKVLNVSRPVITRAESASHPVPSDALLATWAAATGLDLDSLTDLAQRARSGTPDWFMPYRQAEAQADTVRCWSPVQVPGLLQAESYARATLAVEPYTAERLAELVTARMERQAVIGHAYVTAIVDQHVLQRMIGTAAIMAEQCAYLADLAERPDIALHVIPEGTNMGLWGGFDLATRDNTTTVCLTALKDVTSTASDLVVETLRAFERILGAALPRAESLDRIRVAEETWKTQI
jgi:Domain of unknown function (DUF5753)